MTTERIGVRVLGEGWQVFYRGSLENIAVTRTAAEAERIKEICDAERESGRQKGLHQALGVVNNCIYDDSPGAAIRKLIDKSPAAQDTEQE